MNLIGRSSMRAYAVRRTKRSGGMARVCATESSEMQQHAGLRASSLFWCVFVLLFRDLIC